MKRFVYVPGGLPTGEIPADALRLAAESRLQVRIGEPGDGIDATEIAIISIPEIARCEVSPVAFRGRIFEVDATNEFVVFPASTLLRIIYADHEDVFPPRLREKHSVRFRPRLTGSGLAEYRIEVDDETIIYSGTIEVQ